MGAEMVKNEHGQRSAWHATRATETAESASPQYHHTMEPTGRYWIHQLNTAAEAPKTGNLSWRSPTRDADHQPADFTEGLRMDTRKF